MLDQRFEIDTLLFQVCKLSYQDQVLGAELSHVHHKDTWKWLAIHPFSGALYSNLTVSVYELTKSREGILFELEM
jgi:hypothetical protein